MDKLHKGGHQRKLLAIRIAKKIASEQPATKYFLHLHEKPTVWGKFLLLANDELELVVPISDPISKTFSQSRKPDNGITLGATCG